MKRSEMIEIMIEAKQNWTKAYITYSSISDLDFSEEDKPILEDYILKAQEEAGMLPPDEMTSYDQKPDGNWYPYTDHVWEPEND